ncbi:MAG: glutamine--fructose-6-phosphate transaminase (isomerizing) [Candidatus Woesearchaeota archaeon]
MCGIVGYYGIREAQPLLLTCLKQLEYRGYDSAGIAISEHNSQEPNTSKKITTIKSVGNIDTLVKENSQEVQGNKGIAHTRWATNGKVTKVNSHPHISYNKKVTIVHNGIIENYSELKEFLEKKNITSISETDTEIIANLFAYHLETSNVEKAIQTTLNKLKGSFAVVFLIKDEEGLFFAKRESPLVIGHGSHEMFLASDVPAFLEHTNIVTYIEDNQYGIITKKGAQIWSLGKTGVYTEEHIKKEKIMWNLEEAKKGTYPHFMIKEIHEQEKTIKKAIMHPPHVIEKALSILKKAVGVFFVGCGTSYHAAVSASYLFTHIAKQHVNVVIASEFSNYHEFLTDKTVMVVLSQSGETADVLEAMKTAQEKGVKTIAITNVMGSTVMRLADHTLLMNAGPEISVLSTKSYTSQLSLLTYLAYACVGKKNEGIKQIMYAQNHVKTLIQENGSNIKKIAEKIHTAKSLFIIGRDLAYPTALEAALKIKEVSYIHAEGFPGGELKHGTIALIEKNTPCIVINTTATESRIQANADELKARGAYLIGVSETENDIYDEWIKIKDTGLSSPISIIIPFQLLAYYLALAKKCDPDKPRNLAKSVTVK